MARGDIDEGLALIPEVALEASSSTGGTTTTKPPRPAKEPLKLGRNFWILSGVGAFVAVALIATSLVVLAQSPAPEIIEDPIVPVLPEVDAVEETEPPAPIEEEDVSPTIETVAITEAEIVGKTRTQVEELLRQKGLRLDAITGNIAPAADRVATAYRVNPLGTVASNTLIAVYFYAAIPQPPKPRDLIATPATGPYAPGSTVLLEWPSYAQCPSGFALSGYTLQIVGGTILEGDGGNSFQPEQTETTVRLGTGASMKASYLINCANLASPLSSELVVTITAPETDEPVE
jgi:serine/threonine-protein kinase